MKLYGIASVVAIFLVAVFALASPAAAQGIEVPAGPIWSNSDAQTKCPMVCSRRDMGWRGVWHTSQFGRESVCNCVGGGSVWEHHRPGPRAFGSGSSCSVPSVRQCRGCSVSCSEGKSAHCQAGDVGIFNGPRDMICSREARCECR